MLQLMEMKWKPVGNQAQWNRSNPKKRSTLDYIAEAPKNKMVLQHIVLLN